jgi:hypothetical protein
MLAYRSLCRPAVQGILLYVSTVSACRNPCRPALQMVFITLSWVPLTDYTSFSQILVPTIWKFSPFRNYKISLASTNQVDPNTIGLVYPNVQIY